MDRSSDAQRRILSKAQTWREEEEAKENTLNDYEIAIPTAAKQQNTFGAAANKNFKYGFLSAGQPIRSEFTDPALEQLRVNRRNNIMDATRTFEQKKAKGGSATLTLEQLEAAEADRRLAAGMGFGDKDSRCHAYYSQSKEAKPILAPDAHPQLFPTSTLQFPERSPLSKMTPEQTEHAEEQFHHDIASGIGFGPKHTKFHAYVYHTQFQESNNFYKNNTNSNNATSQQ
jgi:hypothetical protein